MKNKNVKKDIIDKNEKINPWFSLFVFALTIPFNPVLLAPIALQGVPPNIIGGIITFLVVGSVYFLYFYFLMYGLIGFFAGLSIKFFELKFSASKLKVVSLILAVFISGNVLLIILSEFL